MNNKVEFENYKNLCLAIDARFKKDGIRDKVKFNLSDNTDTVKEDYEVRDQYYAYALLSKYVKRGAEVYPIECGDEFVAGTAFKNSNGKWVYVFANGSENNKKFAIYNPENFATFDKYVYEKNGLPSNDELLKSKGEFAVRNQVLEFELSANSVVLFNEI